MKVESFNQDVRLLEIARQGRTQPSSAKQVGTESFKDTFSREMAAAGKVNFSKHARQRIFSRGIQISDDKLSQLSRAIDQADRKGSRDTLILDTDAAYVVAVPTRTVVTAFDRGVLTEGVITSIDSAVIL
jgi:flagellar operon protein